MRFISANTAQGPRLGVLVGDDKVALARTESRLEDHLETLPELGAEILATAEGEVALADLALLKPVSPPSMRDFMVFEEHIKPAWARQGRTQGPNVWYEQPIGYFSNAASMRGPRDSVETPGDSEKLDFELEVGAIVSRDLQSVSAEEAASCIAGYLILCDWSARDTQFREMDGALGPYKGKDFASALGPILVTPDEIADRRTGNGYDLLMTSSVNGREYGRDHWSSAYWSFEELISYASWNSVVEAGALIGSGTCQGGCILELSIRHSEAEFPWLSAGDHVSLAIEGFGSVEADVTPASRGAWPHLRSVETLVS